MSSEIGLSVSMDTVMMEVSHNAVEDSKSACLPEMALGKCESNREDDTFHVEVAPIKHGQAVLDSEGDGESNCEDDTSHMGVAPIKHGRAVLDCKGDGQNVEVDVVGNLVADMGEEKVVERESQDATEDSSSFGCTDSESGTADASGDIEVESHYRDDKGSLIGFDRFTDIFGTRKKKLKPQWRQFIRPLMWRCKWAELRIRELQCQESKYFSELKECDRRKQIDLGKYATEDHATKSVPFVCQNMQGTVMKRKKRKRAEETVDLASYTTSHSLFSYFASKRSVGDSAYLDDGHCRAGKSSSGNDGFGIDYELFSLDFNDSDAFESILRKVEEAQAHVRQLKERMYKVVRESTEKCTLDNSSFVPSNPSTNCGPKSVLPLLNDGAVPVASMSATCQWPLNNPALHGSAVSMAGEVSIIMTTNDPQNRVKCEQIENEIPISIQPVKEELGNTKCQTQHIVESCGAAPGDRIRRDHRNSVPSAPSKGTVFQEQSSVKAQSSPKPTTLKNKKKRGRRKARAGRWNRRTSG